MPRALLDGVRKPADALLASCRREHFARLKSAADGALIDAGDCRRPGGCATPASEMFDLVADVEHYPEFDASCDQSLRVRKRLQEDGKDIIVADMTVAYKLVRPKTFTSRVTLDRANLQILVEYLEGPFRRLNNRWSCKPAGGRCLRRRVYACAYEFRQPARIGMLMGAVFRRRLSPFRIGLRAARRPGLRHAARLGRYPSPLALAAKLGYLAHKATSRVGALWRAG